MYVVVSILVCQ